MNELFCLHMSLILVTTSLVDIKAVTSYSGPFGKLLIVVLCQASGANSLNERVSNSTHFIVHA